LLRALIATWKRKLDGDPACPAETVEKLLRALVTPPSFVLPPASTGHARHFMPWFKKGPEDKTLVFDAFVALDKKSEIIVLWPEVSLTTAERATFERIAGCISFIGRAEAWAEARVLTVAEAESALTRINCVCANGASADRDKEPIRVLCADPETAFGNDYTPKHESGDGRDKSKKRIVTPIYDPDWHLCLETLELHDKHWSDPPGSRWVTYLRRKDCFAVAPHKPVPPPVRLKPTVARFALDGTVLPLVEDTLRVGEMARIALMGCYGRLEWRRIHGDQLYPQDSKQRPRSEVFSGKDAQGKPLCGHQHAFYLPTDEDEDGRIDHLTVIAEMGFGPSEVKALDRLRCLKTGEGDPLGLVLLALGRAEAIAAPALFGPAKVWISTTPFLVTRHPKSRGRKKDRQEVLGLGNQRIFARQVLVEEIERLRNRCPGLTTPVSVEPLNEEHRCGIRKLRPIQFKRFRQKRDDDGGQRAASAFRIIFSEAVRGPIALGYSSHFGLGLFAAADS
jgi:CRISPR-associated protein Csb2